MQLRVLVKSTQMLILLLGKNPNKVNRYRACKQILILEV